MNQLKLYLLFVPYTIGILFVPDVYGMKGDAWISILFIFGVTALITSILYCWLFYKFFKYKNITWHSLGHLGFYIALCLSASIGYLKMHHRSGLEGLAAGYFVMFYWCISSMLLVPILLCFAIFPFKKPENRNLNVSKHPIEQEQEAPPEY